MFFCASRNRSWIFVPFNEVLAVLLALRIVDIASSLSVIREATPTQRDAPVDRQKRPYLLAVGPHHLLLIGLTAHLAHHVNNVYESLLPISLLLVGLYGCHG